MITNVNEEPALDFRDIAKANRSILEDTRREAITSGTTSNVHPVGASRHEPAGLTRAGIKSAPFAEQKVEAGAYVGMKRNDAILEEMTHLRNSVKTQRRNNLLAAQQRVAKYETTLEEITAQHMLAINESDAQHDAEIADIQSNIAHLRSMLEEATKQLTLQREEKTADKKRLTDVYVDQVEDLSAMIESERQTVRVLQSKLDGNATEATIKTLNTQGVPIPDSVIERVQTAQQPQPVREYALAT